MLKSGSNCLRVESGACILQPSSSAAGDAARRAQLAASLGMVQAGDAKVSVYCVSRHLPRLLDMPAAARFAYVLTNLVAAPLSSWLRGVQPLQPEVGACSIATRILHCAHAHSTTVTMLCSAAYPLYVYM